jgi:proteasome accessory factor C
VSGTAGAQIDRIVALVAELSRRTEAGSDDATLAELAVRFGVTPDQIRHDVVALTAASEDVGADWLSSIGIQQEGDRLSVTSRGPFRRPVRLTMPELAAIQIGLAAESVTPSPLARAFSALIEKRGGAQSRTSGMRVAPAASDDETRELRLTREAVDQRRLLLFKYAGSGDLVGVDRAVEPHDIVYQEGRYYIVAFCRRADGWRNFRADRVLDASLDDANFTRRADVPSAASGTVFRAADVVDAVNVRFAPSIARWIRERHPDARDDEDGGVIVTYQVSDPQWLVRTVLQYGADAVVVGPEEYRAAMRASLGA